MGQPTDSPAERDAAVLKLWAPWSAMEYGDEPDETTLSEALARVRRRVAAERERLQLVERLLACAAQPFDRAARDQVGRLAVELDGAEHYPAEAESVRLLASMLRAVEDGGVHPRCGTPWKKVTASA